jgi:hypothetical protein
MCGRVCVCVRARLKVRAPEDDIKVGESLLPSE